MYREYLNHTSILRWPRSVKRLFVVAVDVVLSVLAMWLAFTLRLDTPHWPIGVQWVIYIAGPLLTVPIFIRLGLYRAIFRYTGLAAVLATAQATVIYGLLFLSLLLVLQWNSSLQGPGFVPRSIGILQPLIFLLLVGGSRAMARFWLVSVVRSKSNAPRFLVYGAGDAGVQTAAALGSAGQYELLGFVDDDSEKFGSSINDLPVYKPSDVAKIVTRLKVTDILLAIPSVSRERRIQIIKSLQPLPVHIRTLPGMSDLTSGRVTIQDIRELDIEDLLGREPVPAERELLARYLTGKCVLVTGAGGSIGSELCRQILLEKPRQLLLLDHSEFGLYKIHQELQKSMIELQVVIELVPLLGSVTNYPRLAAIFRTYHPQTVYHAAAYKHVPLVEQNAAEGILNNVFGTLNAARAAIENQAERFILISTDKAVRPTNVMGASKRVAEMVLQALANTPTPIFLDDAVSLPRPNKTCLAIVRFGNVLDSSGSVVPLFRQQIADGGPITVTHTDVTRYFMTIAEAAQLVLQAGAMAKGAEVFILDMGQPVKILDLAHRMIKLSGKTVRNTENRGGDIEVVLTGLRTGEKLFEELLLGNNPLETKHPRIVQEREIFVAWSVLFPQLNELHRFAKTNDLVNLNENLRDLVDGYSVSLVSTKTIEIKF